jgi:hypothetical protein
MRLQVSENGRFLVYEDGRPFFYLGDTAWELFHRLNREEADLYLRDRAEKNFTVIQAVALAEMGGLRVPNAYGHTPLHDNDPTRPNEAYFQQVDWIVDKAESLGLFIGLLPTWGDKWNKLIPFEYAGPEIFTSENARIYGEWLGRRYRDKPIIWVLGGDRGVENENHVAIHNAMAEGLTRGDEGRHLRTFHPRGGQSSSQDFHHAEWLDFNMLQSGHVGRHQPNYDKIARDYALSPAKPCLDGEPRYEDHPVMTPQWDQEPGDLWFDDYDVRKAAYWALFAGACGHTYGCHDIWQMWEPKHEVINRVRTPWFEAIHLPGAAQMQHARTLLESRPFLTRIPDQQIVLSDIGTGGEHIQATRDAEGRYAMIYIPQAKTVTVDTSTIAAPQLRAWWYDPRNGTAQLAGEYSNEEQREFTPPASGEGSDWVLVIDDAAQNFAAPGQTAMQ